MKANPDFAQIKATTDMVRVVESYRIALKREGKDYVGLCPFHEDKEPSLRVTPGKGLFRCPACNAAGNVIQFVAKKEGLTDREAAFKLCGSIPGVRRGSELPTAGEEKPSSLAVDDATRSRLLARVIGSVRRYELCAIEKPSAARLKATVKALAGEAHPGQAARLFHIDTVDFYLSRSRKGFIAEAARLFRELPEAVEADVNRIIVALEKYAAQKLEGAPVVAVAVPDGDRLEALRMGRSAGLVDEMQRDFGKLGIVGEETNRLLLYLAMTSRKMDDPLAVQILSSSGAGKSHLQDAVLSLCPEEDLIKLTSLTGQALFYKGEDSLRHKCLAIAEVAGAEGALRAAQLDQRPQAGH